MVSALESLECMILISHLERASTGKRVISCKKSIVRARAPQKLFTQKLEDLGLHQCSFKRTLEPLFYRLFGHTDSRCRPGAQWCSPQGAEKKSRTGLI